MLFFIFVIYLFAFVIVSFAFVIDLFLFFWELFILGSHVFPFPFFDSKFFLVLLGLAWFWALDFFVGSARQATAVEVSSDSLFVFNFYVCSWIFRLSFFCLVFAVWFLCHLQMVMLGF